MASAVFHVETASSAGAPRLLQDTCPSPASLEAAPEERPIRLMILAVGLEIGGTEGQIVELASRLNRTRFDVVVCVLKGDGVLARALRQRGVRVILLNGCGKGDIRVLFRLWRVIQQERPHVIHAFLFFANLAARVLGKMLKVPVLLSSYRGPGEWNGWVRIVADRLTVQWSSAVTCCSDAVRWSAMFLIGGPHERYQTIHNGVDCERFAGGMPLGRAEVGLRDGLPVIGTVCRLDGQVKGLPFLLEAVAQLNCASGSLPCQMLIVGDGPAHAELRGLSVKLGIAEQVVFMGARCDVERLLPLMDIFVLPSLAEGFGIAIVEAMAAARPVVATAVGGIPEIVVDGDTGLLVPPGDSVALAAAIERLLRDPAYARSLGERGRLRARQKFSIESAVRKHEELYEALLANAQQNRKG